jgi:hypothetical protein
MPILRTILTLALLLKLPVALAQNVESSEPIAVGTEANANAVVGHPFSAILYSHRVAILDDGKQRFIRNERYPVELARDSNGRVRLQAVALMPECDHLELLNPPPCPCWEIIVFDPMKETITHWLEGEIAGKGAAQFDLSPPQLQEWVDLTAVMPEEPASESDDSDAKVSTELLANTVMEGVPVTGIRTSSVHPAGYQGNKIPTTTIHEVWSSPEMKLTIRVVDGNPRGEEVISELKDISLQADRSRFDAPDGYGFRQAGFSSYVDLDKMEKLAAWFVR